MVQLFLDAGADVEARDKDDQTPLHHTALFQEAEMRYLLARGASIEAGDRRGRTPLFEAAAQGFCFNMALTYMCVMRKHGRFCISRLRTGSRSLCICSLSMDLMYRARPVEKRQHCILRSGNTMSQLCACSSDTTLTSERRMAGPDSAPHGSRRRRLLRPYL